MRQKKEETLWVAKYRPKTVDEYASNDKLLKLLTNAEETGQIDNLLFHGIQGTGKTSCALLLTELIDCDYLYINASDERGIDVIREKVVGFASVMGFSELKIIILDECLHEDTLVTVLRNNTEIKIKISDVNDNLDLVKSYNIDTNTVEWVLFTLLDKGEQDIWEIYLENGEVVKCTETHKWFVYDDFENIIVVNTNELNKYNYILSPV